MFCAIDIVITNKGDLPNSIFLLVIYRYASGVPTQIKGSLYKVIDETVYKLVKCINISIQFIFPNEIKVVINVQ